MTPRTQNSYMESRESSNCQTLYFLFERMGKRPSRLANDQNQLLGRVPKIGHGALTDI